MKPSLPFLLSLNGGYVDTAGYLALQGLFTSHVTGNFVTLGAALVLGTSGVIAKLLALPLFCTVVFTTRLLSTALHAHPAPALRFLLRCKLLLLGAGALLAIHFGPFRNGDGWQALVTGMTLVAAMAIQNAIHRIHMPSTSPTTIMTGNTTQLMIDLADMVRPLEPATRAVISARLRRLAASVAAFALGCSVAALTYALRGEWCFIVPPLVGLYIVLRREPAGMGEAVGLH
ncbi:MAG TPA: YoaK family protein [Candidatus Dormibacteraeota bacterium]|nr:YoaK family protein [Candidatus Dormibacteraeota bacterium]